MKKLILFALLLSIGFMLKAEQIHIKFDDTCLERLVYNVKTFNGKNFDLSGKYISYRVKSSASEFVYLNVGEDNDELLRVEPKNTISCSEITFNEDFVQKINSYSNEVFIVKKVGEKYSVSPVQYGEYFFSFEDEITYADRDYGFNYNYQINDTKANLLTFGVKSKVSFSFRNDETCPSEYHFKKESRQKNQDNHGLVFVPDLGLVKKNVIDRKTKKLVKQYELTKINGVEALTYMEIMCNGDEEMQLVEAKPKKKAAAKKEKVIEVAGLDTKAAPKAKAKSIKPATSLATAKATTPKAKAAKAKAVLPTLVEESACSHIYKDLDKGGFYYDRNTGLPAEGICGGITYTKGTMEGRDDKGAEILYTEAQVRDTIETVLASINTKQAEQKVVYKDSAPKVVYKDPKIIYKEANPIVIEKTAVSNQQSIPAANQHLVQKGETLYRLSKMYNVSIDELRKWNNIDNDNTISIGTLVQVTPLTFEAIVPANDLVSKGNASAPTYHIVNAGETLYSISKRYNTTVANIKQANGMISDALQPGMKLKLKADVPTVVKPVTKPAVAQPAKPAVVQPTTAAPPVISKSTTVLSATVKKEKPTTIINVEKAGEVTVQQPKEILPPPAEKIISNNTTSHTIHTVTESETIEIIAKKYNTTVEAIRKANNMENGEVLIPFQKIAIK